MRFFKTFLTRAYRSDDRSAKSKSVKSGGESFNHRFGCLGKRSREREEKKKTTHHRPVSNPLIPSCEKKSLSRIVIARQSRHEAFDEQRRTRHHFTPSFPTYPAAFYSTRLDHRSTSQPSKNRRYTHTYTQRRVRCLPSGHVVGQGRGTERRRSIRRSETCTHGVHTTRLCPVFSCPLETFRLVFLLALCVYTCVYIDWPKALCVHRVWSCCLINRRGTATYTHTHDRTTDRLGSRIIYG